ncbi:MAG: hypothetical protein CVU03_01350 [Bacteroidetes bacterium HGW-Bacteroidetes-2]|jgi:hypothetical protein|nr:MAG: hypothetical protein CVU03_01350 [Bacteroidetes bacterium HGW-Bacteroidetes-2]
MILIKNLGMILQKFRINFTESIVNQEVEYLFFFVIIVFILLGFIYIIRTSILIYKQQFIHKINTNYFKQLIMCQEKGKIDAFSEDNFNEKQKKFYTAILVLKSRWIDLKLFLNALQN